MTNQRQDSHRSSGPRRTGIRVTSGGPPFGDLDPLRRRGRETSLILSPPRQLQPRLLGPEPLRTLRQRVGIKFLSSQDATIHIPPRQPQRTLLQTRTPQQPTQRPSHTVPHSQTHAHQRPPIPHTPRGAQLLARQPRRTAPVTHHQRRPQLSTSQPPRHRHVRPARDRCRATAQHPRHRGTPRLDPHRLRGRLPRRARHPKNILNLCQRRYHPRRQHTHPRHDIEYDHTTDNPMRPSALHASGGRGAAPDPDTTSESRGRSPGWLPPPSATKPCQPAGHSAQGKPHPCTPDPPPDSPPGAPRGDNQPHHPRPRRNLARCLALHRIPHDDPSSNRT